jgi:nitroreductase
MAYFELLAQSSGLGTLWLGLLRRALELSPDLKELLGLPADHGYYAMLFGYPAVRYQRTVQRGRGAKVQVIGAIPPTESP